MCYIYFYSLRSDWSINFQEEGDEEENEDDENEGKNEADEAN